MLALVVGLQSADAGTVGALAVPLRDAMHIDNTQVGLLVTVSTGVGAVTTLLAGALADRTVRVRLLWATLLICSAAMALSAMSSDYGGLLACRVALGAGVAVSGPVVASLIGDYFLPGERGRVYGMVLAGEGTCTAVGLLVAGELGAVSWRLGFWWMAVVGFVLSVAVATMLREPLRGGTSRPAHEVRSNAPATDRRLLASVRHVLSIRTNIVLVVGCSFGYFFFAGLSTFGVALLCGRLHVGQAVATLLVIALGGGAAIGVLTSGRLADWLMTRGHLSARLAVGGAGFLAAAIFTLPSLLTHSLPLAIGFAFLAAIALGGVNPPLNAARLDIVTSRLWGTAEAVRTTLVSVSTGLAPLVFGLISTKLGDSTAEVSSGTGRPGGSGLAGGLATGAVAALEHTFLIMLGALVIAAALILFVGCRTYPGDVAAAIAEESAMPDRPAPSVGVGDAVECVGGVAVGHLQPRADGLIVG